MSLEVPEGWVSTTLGELAQISGGMTPSKEVAEFWEGGRHFWATPTDITALPPGKLSVSSTKTMVSDAALQKTSLKMLPVGSVLMTSRATIGYPAINTVPIATNQGFANFHPSATYDAAFLVYWIVFSRKIFERTAGGSTFPEISKSTLRAIPIALPPLHEQRRIAEILSSVDEAIAATRAVIEQTRKVKQGVLERLLTKGIGHTRFKQTEIGEIPEGWEVTQVGQIARLQPGYAFKSAEFADSGIRLLRGSNVGVGSFDWSEGVTKHFPAERVDEFSDYQLGENDIIIAMDRPFISAGFKVARLQKSDLPCLLLQRVGRLIPTGECDPDWLWQITSAGSVRRHLEKQQVGTDLPHISRSDIESCTVALPPIAEQKAIATILEPLDTRTDLLMRSLSSGECLKSALMSDLLTGRKRVTDALPMAAE